MGNPEKSEFMTGGKMRSTLAVVAAALLLSAPASADFSVSKPKPAKPAPKPTAKPKPPTTRPMGAVKPKPQPQSVGFDPVMVHEAITAAGLKANLIVNPADGSQRIDGTSGTSAWSVAMKECTSAKSCRLVEYNLAWRVNNDANVCRSWYHYVTDDESGAKGLPACYTVPPSGKEFRLWLSTDQAPYAGIDKAPRAETLERLTNMAKTWNEYVARLPEAREIANKKCPRKKDLCW
jgi:hypothetical protein